MKKIQIYELIDPRTNQTRYIGKSTNAKIRYSRHLNLGSLNKSNNHKNLWIKSLLKINLKPVLNVIDEVEESDWVFFEKFYISLYKTWGFNLTNSTEGGENGYTNGKGMNEKKHSEKTKEKMKIKALGRIISEEQKKITKEVKIKNGTWRKPMSQEAKEKRKQTKIKNGTWDKPMSESLKKEFSLKRKGKGNPCYHGEVCQYDLNGVFIKEWQGLFEITEKMGNCNNVSNVAKGKSKSAKGYLWKFKKNINDINNGRF